MVALNKTSSLWSKRLSALARESEKKSGVMDDAGPMCCFLLCNICCWVVSC